MSKNSHIILVRIFIDVASDDYVVFRVGNFTSEEIIAGSNMDLKLVVGIEGLSKIQFQIINFVDTAKSNNNPWTVIGI